MSMHMPALYRAHEMSAQIGQPEIERRRTLNGAASSPAVDPGARNSEITGRGSAEL